MKKKTDYITNSSSYSFVCFGIRYKNLSKDQLDEIHKVEDELNDQDKYDEIYEGYIHWFGPDCDCLGCSPKNMKLEETLLEFKQRICDELLKKFRITLNPEDIEYVEELVG